MVNTKNTSIFAISLIFLAVMLMDDGNGADDPAPVASTGVAMAARHADPAPPADSGPASPWALDDNADIPSHGVDIPEISLQNRPVLTRDTSRDLPNGGYAAPLDEGRGRSAAYNPDAVQQANAQLAVELQGSFN